MFISQKYWKYLFGYICFFLSSYACSLFSLFFKLTSTLMVLLSFWMDLTKQLNSKIFTWLSSLMVASLFLLCKIYDFYYSCDNAIRPKFNMFLYQIFTILKYATSLWWPTASTTKVKYFDWQFFSEFSELSWKLGHMNGIHPD